MHMAWHLVRDRYLIIHIKRFSTNTQFEVEKNPTIVAFPIKNLDLRDFLEMPQGVDPSSVTTRYDLVCANLSVLNQKPLRNP